MRRNDVLKKIAPISELSQGKAARILRRVTDENEVIIMKNNRPVAIIISPDQYDSYCELAEICSGLVEAGKPSPDERAKIRELLDKTKLFVPD